MTIEIPYYGLRAYALFFSKYGENEEFKQAEVDWILSESMKKKTFSLLLRSGWILKTARDRYRCKPPKEAIIHLLDFRVPKEIIEAKKEYVFTELSAVEIWSDYSYVQRGIEKSPYFIKIYKKDVGYWKTFFNKRKIPNYINKGTSIGEYVILVPVEKLDWQNKGNMKVETLKNTKKIAKQNPMYEYAYNYIKKKYGE